MIPFQSPAGLGFNRYLRRFLLAADPSGSAFLPFPFSVKYPGVSRRFASELILSHPPHCCQYFPAFFFWNIPHRTDPMRMTVLNVSHTDKTVNTSPRFFSPFFSHRVRIPLIPLSFSRYYNVLYQEKIISRTIQCFFSFLRLVIVNHTMISTTTVIAANSYGYLKILTKHIFLFIISFIFLLQSRVLQIIHRHPHQ